MTITLKSEDVKQDDDYTSPENCPMARVLSRELGRPVKMSIVTVHQPHTEKILGQIDRPFLYDDFLALKGGFAKEFVTEYTPV